MIADTGVRGVLVMLLLLAGCDAGPAPTGEWTGAVRDSAGVEVVDNPVTGVWTSATAWRLEEELRIGAAHEDDSLRVFGRVAGIAVNAAGQIHILDRQAQQIRVFDADGEFIRTIGRGGGGPGELSGPSAVLIGTGDTVLVPDMANQRVQRFTSDGAEAGSFRIPLAGEISLAWHMRDDGFVLEEVRTLPGATPGSGAERVLLRVRTVDGEVGETLVEMPVGEAMTFSGGGQQMTVFAPEPRWAPLADGRIGSGWNAEYRLKIHSSGGELVRVISKPFERRPFGESDRRALLDLFRQQFEDQPPSPAIDQMLQSMRYAEHYPAFADLFGGPAGTFWVRHLREVSSLNRDDMGDFDARGVGGPDYDVFGASGRFLGTISTPRRFEPMITHDDRIYGVERDELGVQYVVRLGVVR